MSVSSWQLDARKVHDANIVWKCVPVSGEDFIAATALPSFLIASIYRFFTKPPIAETSKKRGVAKLPSCGLNDVQGIQ